MYLLINAAVHGNVSFTLLRMDGTCAEQKTYSGQNKDVILHLVDFLQETKIEKEAIAGIGLVEGVGGFTSTRIATLIANTFAYVRRIPVLGISEVQFAHPTNKIVLQFVNQSAGVLLHPTYSGEPNIRM